MHKAFKTFVCEFFLPKTSDKTGIHFQETISDAIFLSKRVFNGYNESLDDEEFFNDKNSSK